MPEETTTTKRQLPGWPRFIPGLATALAPALVVWVQAQAEIQKTKDRGTKVAARERATNEGAYTAVVERMALVEKALAAKQENERVATLARRHSSRPPERVVVRVEQSQDQDQVMDQLAQEQLPKSRPPPPEPAAIEQAQQQQLQEELGW